MTLCLHLTIVTSWLVPPLCAVSLSTLCIQFSNHVVSSIIFVQYNMTVDPNISNTGVCVCVLCLYKVCILHFGCPRVIGNKL